MYHTTMSILFVFLCLFLSVCEDGIVLYVKTDGDNSQSCESLEFACATIIHAMDKGNNNTVHILAGIYTFGGVRVQECTLIGNSQLETAAYTQINLLEIYEFRLVKMSEGGSFSLKSLRLVFGMNATFISPSGLCDIIISDVIVKQTGNIGFRFVEFTCDIVLSNVVFDSLTIISLFYCNKINATNVNITNIFHLSSPVLSQSRSNVDGIAIFLNCLMENFTTTIGPYREYGCFIFSPFEISSCTWRNVNVAGYCFAPVAVGRGQNILNFYNVTFTNNCGYYCGGIFAQTYISFNMTDCKFFSNTASVRTEWNFSDIYFEYYASVTTSDNFMTSCSRSCMPRLNTILESLLPDCDAVSDADGFGEIDSSSCPLHASVDGIDLFVQASSGDDNRSCRSLSLSCATVSGAVGKGYNNTIRISPGSFIFPNIIINFKRNGYSLRGNSQLGDVSVWTELIVSSGSGVTISSQIGTFLNLEKMRLLITDSQTNPFIHVATVSAPLDSGGYVNVTDVAVTPTSGSSYIGCYFLLVSSRGNGQIVLLRVSFDSFRNEGPLVRADILDELTVIFSWINITNFNLTGVSELISFKQRCDIYSFHDLLFENISAPCCMEEDNDNNCTNEYGLINFDVISTSMNFSQSAFRNISLCSSYTAPVYFSVRDVYSQSVIIWNVIFVNNSARHCGGISINGILGIWMRNLTFLGNKGIEEGAVSDLQPGKLAEMDIFTPSDFIESCSSSDLPRISVGLEVFLPDCFDCALKGWTLCEYEEEEQEEEGNDPDPGNNNDDGGLLVSSQIFLILLIAFFLL